MTKSQYNRLIASGCPPFSFRENDQPEQDNRKILTRLPGKLLVNRSIRARLGGIRRPYAQG